MFIKISIFNIFIIKFKLTVNLINNYNIKYLNSKYIKKNRYKKCIHCL